MRRAGLVFGLVVLALLVPGCVGPPTHEDRTVFRAAGAYDAAVAAGAHVLRAREDPGDPGSFFPSLPLASPDLDAAWGKGRYALTTVHWWGPPGPPGPPAAGGEDGATRAQGSGWQGFLVGRGRVQVTLGDVPEETARAWYDRFLVHVTVLSEAGRKDAVDALFAGCGLGCTGPVPEGFDASRAWEGLGGLSAAVPADPRPGGGRFDAGSWSFRFDWHEARLASWTGGTSLRVGAGDVVEFVWQGQGTRSDAASYEKLVDVAVQVGITPPPPEALTWLHQEIYHDRAVVSFLR